MPRISIFRSLAVNAAAAVCVVALPSAAFAARTATQTTCAAPSVSQVFGWAGDSNWYAPVPGESWDSMSSRGWTLSGGAKFETTTLLDGRKGMVLDLPSGAKAVSPVVCVTNDYPFARTEVRDLSGSAGVNVYVSYVGNRSYSNLFSGNVAGSGSSWSLPRSFNIVRTNLSTWQQAQLTLVASGANSEYQISNFYVDPRMHH